MIETSQLQFALIPLRPLPMQSGCLKSMIDVINSENGNKTCFAERSRGFVDVTRYQMNALEHKWRTKP